MRGPQPPALTAGQAGASSARSQAAPLALVLTLALGCAAGEVDSPARAHATALLEGETALAEGDLPAAEEAFCAALRAVPHEAQALHGLARTHLERGDAEAALHVLQELEDFHGQKGRRLASAERCRALEAAVRGRLERGDSEQALSAARALSAASCEPETSARLLWQSLLAEAQRERAEARNDRAIELFRAAAVVDSSEPDAFAEAAALLLAEERQDEALELLSAALVDHPGDRNLLDLMVEALLEP